MHQKFCVPVRNNWYKYVTCKQIAKSMTFCVVSSVLLEYIIEYIWKMINGSHRDELKDYSYIKIACLG